jgi:hypothetical protein
MLKPPQHRASEDAAMAFAWAKQATVTRVHEPLVFVPIARHFIIIL